MWELYALVLKAPYHFLVWLDERPLVRLQRRQENGLCINCGYDLRGSPKRCPECGNLISPTSQMFLELLRQREQSHHRPLRDISRSS